MNCFKKYLNFIIITLLLFNCCNGSSVPENPELSIKESYTYFINALDKSNGELASNYVTEDIFDFYKKCGTLALNSSSEELENKSLLEVITTLSLRLLGKKDELEKMSGKDIFIWAIEKGMIKKESINKIKLDTLNELKDKKAYMNVLNMGKKVPNLFFQFELISNKWKFNYYPIMQLAEGALDNIRKNAGKTKIELGIYLLEKTYGKEIPPSILVGPLK